MLGELRDENPSRSGRWAPSPRHGAGAGAFISLCLYVTLSACSADRSMAARYDAGPRLTAFVPHCDGDEVIRVELLRDEAGHDYNPETLWTLRSAQGFGSERWFVAGASAPGEYAVADPEVTAEIEQTGSDAIGFKAYTRQGDWFEVWFGFEGTPTDGRIPSDGSMTTGRIDPISGDRESLDRFERDRCEGRTIRTESVLTIVLAGLGCLITVGAGYMLRRRSQHGSHPGFRCRRGAS